jgi:hypothetical protein
MGAIVSRELDLLYPRSTKIVTNWLGDRRRRTCSTIEGYQRRFLLVPPRFKGARSGHCSRCVYRTRAKARRGLWTLWSVAHPLRRWPLGLGKSSKSSVAPRPRKWLRQRRRALPVCNRCEGTTPSEMPEGFRPGARRRGCRELRSSEVRSPLGYAVGHRKTSVSRPDLRETAL